MCRRDGKWKEIKACELKRGDELLSPWRSLFAKAGGIALDNKDVQQAGLAWTLTEKIVEERY